MTHSACKIYFSVIYYICSSHVSVNRTANKTVNVRKSLNYLICRVETFFLLHCWGCCCLHVFINVQYDLMHVTSLKDVPLLTSCHPSNIFLILFTYSSN